ncbi:BamA/TamA family outer membrane protein [Nonlabens sp. Ci31]|uniref:BamA/TamA family outer membrane protein n=1 Tax=Nonlabens sp. Ci31 TaxID=2608253 RepID=UPI0014638E1C|nr:BamA/TamA family outer membrane protein [Nonlabens sp. Ci31]QJP34471.1 BamA/TamA family outer membrane protein [Nonlabens sp. Ci31]
MKHTYALIIYMLFLNLGICQNNQLQLAFKKTRVSPADSLVQILLKDRNSLQLTDSIRASLWKKGYLNLLIHKQQKINDSLQQLEIVLNRKYSHVRMKEDTVLGKEVMKVISLSRKRNFIPINEIENFLSELNNRVKQEGFPFTKTKLANFKFDHTDTIEATLTISQRRKRFINRITVKGYDKFPTNTLQNFTKRKNTYNDRTIERLEKSLDNMPFVKKTKETEVLFKQDSTTVFIYLEKIKTNSADGLIGFNNSNKGKLELNGYVNLKLQNNLDRAETFLLEYRNDNGDQTRFTTSIDLPYLWKTPLGINSMLEIQRRDSTYQRTSITAGLFYKPDWSSTLGINYISTTSTATGQDANLEDFSKNGIELRTEIKKQTTDLLMPENLWLTTRIGMNKRTIENNSENQFNFHATFLKLWHLSYRSKFLGRLTSTYLKSDNIQFNELYQFGGLGSIRGFNQNSIDSSFYTTLATEYRYRLNDQIYLHSILDIGVFENFNSKKLDELYGFGGGIAILTQAGILNLSIANGRFDDAKVDLSSTVAHINLKINF